MAEDKRSIVIPTSFPRSLFSVSFSLTMEAEKRDPGNEVVVILITNF